MVANQCLTRYDVKHTIPYNYAPILYIYGYTMYKEFMYCNVYMWKEILFIWESLEKVYV